MTAVKASDQRMTQVGLIVIALIAVSMAAAFNLQKFPGFRGTQYHAEFADASGLHVGGRVEIAGVKVGRVERIRIDGTKVVADFDIKGGHRLGSDTTASINVLNLLGEKYVDLVPHGSDRLPSGATIRLDHTHAGYDIVATLSQLTDTTEKLDTQTAAKALQTVSDTMKAASPEIRGSLEGVARLSQTIADNDQDVEQLLTHAASVAKTVDERKVDLLKLMQNSDKVFRELIRRREDIHALLVAARSLSNQLTGLVKDNEKEIGPALRELQTGIDFLNRREKLIQDTVKYYGPYAFILINIIGTGPWFDAYVPNILGFATPEFKQGHRPELSR
jgi:phospholipid/cholesterol/gamma-HCH transport system substrate-binding protein